MKAKTIIQFVFLQVEEGKESIVTVPTDATAEDVARIIRNNLSDGRSVLTDAYIDHEFEMEG